MRAKRIASLLLENEGGLNFTTKITDTSLIDIHGTPADWYLQGVAAVIEWSAEIDARSWGIKEIDTFVRTVRVDCVFEIGEAGEERLIEYVYPLKQSGADPDDLKATALEMTGAKALEVTSELEGRTSDRGSGLAVIGIEIRHGTGQCVVQFG